MIRPVCHRQFLHALRSALANQRQSKEHVNTTRSPKPHELKKLAITKLNAARRQLETAITLWFHDADPISVHTLVMAAHGILRALNKKRGGEPMLGDPTSPYIRPGFEKRVADMFVKSSNFFKHGAKDPLTTDYFAPESNQYMILDACRVFTLLAQEKRPLMWTFIFYLAFHEPEVFLPEFLDPIQREPLFSATKQLSKLKFFAEWLPDISGYSPIAAASQGNFDAHLRSSPAP
jgi:hypothetical protein